ncbi:hypothetical protein VST7929_02866 [Vibrio stylophorae]|uniref:DUF2878 domain-containing protein n=1 Tax=Vibrio stylophorae TaxID=659351 RepID=A0ABM8ZX10_9VIBR|nr:DUF2878 domain-containing protein [Vibrio stylophorae]CAH0535205.1 hypothetical protein VST7929_02866 [Vibrio stylophorae]
MKYLVYSLWFQLVWLVAVLGQQTLLPWLLALLFVNAVIIHRYFSFPIWLPLVIAMLGVVLDILNRGLGVFEFSTPRFPLWLVCLWVAFGAYLLVMTPVLKQLGLFAVAVIGALAGAISYWAGFKLGVVTWPRGENATVIILAIEWGIMLPVLHHLAVRMLKRAGGKHALSTE